MFRLFVDPHRRHFLLTLLVAVGLVLYLAEPLQAWLRLDLGLPAVQRVAGFDLAMLLALIGGLPIYWEALSALLRRSVSADLAVSLAAFAALYIGQYAVAAEVIFIMLIGESLEHFAVQRTRSGIAALLSLRPQTARVRRGDHEHLIPAHEVQPDDVVLLRPGDRIPIDGRVIAGYSSVDQSPITGESLPADKSPGDEVFAGTINLHGAMELAVERLGHDTTLERIIHLVEHAEAAKAPSQRLADRYAAWFVPIVLVVAAITYFFTRSVERSVAVLVVACPCAMVLATPTAIAAGLGRLVRRGVLIKGGVVLETLGRLRTVIFDKTGTLTLARLRIEQIVPAPGHDESTVLRLGAAVERQSEHPVGRLLVERAGQQGLPAVAATHFAAHPGLGAEAVVEDANVRVGSLRYMELASIGVPAELLAQAEQLGRQGCTVVFVAHEGEAIGAVAARDTLRPEAAETVRRLRELGIGPIVMLTGDHAAAARSIAAELGIDDVRSDLLPADKLEAVHQLQRAAPPVAMVGDGINDAPSLAAADVGVALADIGTDVAIASAGVVLVGDDLRKLVDAVACARQMLRIVWQNILGFALVFNLAAVLAAAMGWISPVVAAVVHQVSSLTVVLNSLRLLVDAHAWSHRLEHAWHHLRHRRQAIVTAAVAAAAAVRVLSGLHRVGVGQVGVVQRFGRIVEPIEGPGLHYRLPYPLGRHFLVRPQEIRRVEIGFRSAPGMSAEPPAYEWNVQHRGGRYQRQDDEAAVWAGDENLADVNAVVHYRVADPLAALFAVGPEHPSGDNKWDVLVRDLAESCLRTRVVRRPVDALLASERAEIAEVVRSRMTDALHAYGDCFAVQAVCLGDVHPPLEVVPAFRDVASAMEEKEARINDAEAYQLETEAQARTQASQRVTVAEGFQHERTHKAEGAASRFIDVARAYAAAPELTGLRLYLQTVEDTLAGRRKVIFDRHADGSRRLLYLGRKGIWNAVPAAPEQGTREGGQGPGEGAQGTAETDKRK